MGGGMGGGMGAGANMPEVRQADAGRVMNLMDEDPSPLQNLRN